MPLLQEFWSWIAQHAIATLIAAWVLLSLAISITWVIAQRKRTAKGLAKLKGRVPRGKLNIPLHIEKDNIQAALGNIFWDVEERAALEIEAGQLVYQIPEQMWRDTAETVEVRLGRQEAIGMMMGFVGSEEVKTADTPIVETMSVRLWCPEHKAFLIEPKHSDAQQLVTRDKIKGTALEGDDFGSWQWVVTPKEAGTWKLFVTVSAGLTDSRGVPVTTSLPPKTFPVTVRVHLVRATAAAIGGAVPAVAWVIVTTLVGIFTRDYWWPFISELIGLG